MGGIAFPIPPMPQDVPYDYISKVSAALTASSTANRVDLSDIDNTIHRIMLTLKGLQNSTSLAPTRANTLAAMGTVAIERAGSKIWSIDADDLHNYQVARYNGNVLFEVAASTDDRAFSLGIIIDSSPYSTRSWVDPRFGWRRNGQSFGFNLETGAYTGLDTLTYELTLYMSNLKTGHALNIRQNYAKSTTNAGKDDISLGQGNIGLSEIQWFDTTTYDDGITAHTGVSIDRFSILRSDKEDVLRSIRASSMRQSSTQEGDVSDEGAGYFQIAPALLLNKPTKLQVLGGSAADAARVNVGLLEPN